MGVLSYITDKLRGEATPPTIVKDWDKQESSRTEHFEKLYDYYVGDEKAITESVQQAMGRTFKPQSLVKMQFPYYPLVRRVIDRLCMAYKVSPDRYIVVPHKVTVEGTEYDPTQERYNEIYQELLEASNIAVKCKQWHQLARLLDTVYVQVVWRTDHIEFDIFPPHLIQVQEREDNYLEPESVKFEAAFGDENYWVYWSEDQHWIVDKDNRPVEGMNEAGGVNPYGVLPFLPLRLRETEDHWGHGDTQLVDINEKINILLASTFHNAVMQSHGQAVAINFEFSEGEEIRTGPDVVLQAKNVSSDMARPEFTFVQPQPAIEACLKQIDWMVKTAAVMRGLPAASMSIDETAQSGAAKAIDNWELLELREQDIDWLRPFEKRLFNVCLAVWNFHQSGKKIPVESVQFGIDFNLDQVPVPELEELKAKELKLKWGLWTPVDDMIDEDEGIDEETAKGLISKNLQTAEELGLRGTQAVADDRASAGAENPDNGRNRSGDDQEQDGQNPAE